MAQLTMRPEAARLIEGLVKVVKADAARPALDMVRITFDNYDLKEVGNGKPGIISIDAIFTRTDSYRLVFYTIPLGVEVPDDVEFDEFQTAIKQYLGTEWFVKGEDLVYAIKTLTAVKTNQIHRITLECLVDGREGSPDQGKPIVYLSGTWPSALEHELHKPDMQMPAVDKLLSGSTDPDERRVERRDQILVSIVTDEEANPPTDSAVLYMPAWNSQFLADMHKLQGPTATIRRGWGPVQPTHNGTDGQTYGSDFALKPTCFVTRSALGRFTYLLMPVRM